VKWHIEGRIRATIHSFTGLNFSGQRSTTEIWPSGGRQGDEIDGSRLKCIGLIAPVGTRLTLITSSSETGWERLPWRAIVLCEGSHFDSKQGRPAVQVPNIDVLDDYTSLRSDTDLEFSYPHADDLESGSGWTYGRTGTILLKCNIRQIRVDRVAHATMPHGHGT